MKIVSASPHLHSANSTPKIMRDVLIALSPAFAFSIYAYGLSALTTAAVAVLSCMLFEWLISRFLLSRGNTLPDYSAALTGLLLAFNLPAVISPWIVVLGALVAIGVGKMSFGGLGRNPFNPALVGRVFLLISFPVQMTTYTSFDGVTGATPLAILKEQGVGALSSTSDILLGFRGGSMGEIAGLLLILGGIYLLVRRVITWHIPVAVIGSIAAFAAILYFADSSLYPSPLFQVFAGGALLGAVFMATDYVTSPMSRRGMIIYGVGIGVLTILIRTWGAYPEGISFAILIMNACVPLINMYVKPRRFGIKK